MKHILFILLLIACSSSLWSQRVFEGNVIETKSSDKEILQETFKKQTLFTFDIAKFNAYVKANSTFSNFQLKIGNEHDWDINLEENELRAPGYMSIAMTDAGPIELPRTECITFAGFLKGTDQQVRLNIESNRVWGFIDSPKGTFYIEPLNRFIKNAEKDTYLVYKSTELVDHGHKCTADHNHTSHHQINDLKDDIIGEQKITGDDCRKLEIATEADFEFHDDGLDNDDIIANLNLVEANYFSTFNMKFFVVFQNIWTTSADPYDALGACGQGPFLSEFQNYWIANFSHIRRDINVLYSGKTLISPTIGCAFTGSFRNNADNDNGAYCVNQWQSTSLSNQVIIGHEMGHIFGSPHIINTTGIMNPFLGSSIVFQDSAQVLMNAGMDFVSTTLNDGRSALRIRDFPINANTPVTTVFTNLTNNSANEWHMEGEVAITNFNLLLPTEGSFKATEKIILKPGFKASVISPGNSLKLEIGACDINGN